MWCVGFSSLTKDPTWAHCTRGNEGKHRVLATRPPGKLYFTFKKKLIEVVFYSQKWKISAPGHKRKVIKQISSGIKLELAPVTCRIHLRLTL